MQASSPEQFEQLQERLQRTERYLNSTSAIILALDNQAKVTFLNQKGQQFLGVNEADILGKSWFELGFLRPENNELLKEMHANYIGEKITLNSLLDYELITQNHDYKMFTWSNSLLRDESTAVIGSLSTAIDTTERSLFEKELQRSESQLNKAHKLAKIGHYTIDFKSNHWSYSSEIGVMFGIINTYPNTIDAWLNLTHPDHQKNVKTYFQDAVVKKSKYFDIQYQIINQSTQNTLWVHSKGKFKYDENGDLVEIFGTLQDISEQKEIESKLTLAGNVFDNTSEGIMVTDRQNNIIYVNQAFTTITGYSTEEVLGKNARILSSGIHSREFYKAIWQHIESEGQWQGEIWSRRKSGDLYPEFININTIKDSDSKVQHYLALFSDISKQKSDELKLKNMAHFDSLTGLPNRVLFSKRLSQAIERANSEESLISLAFIDLDGFKQINDHLGHEIGDQMLKVISSRYSQEIAENDIVARIGGDEFVILLNHHKQSEEVFTTIERLRAVTNQPIYIDGHQLQVTCSIGITHYPQNSPVDADQLIRQADNAMYQAKVLGKNKHHIFDNHKDQQARAHHQEIIAMQQAIQEGQLVVYYQPKKDMRTCETIGLEALVRWQHPQKGLLQPADFLPAIERQPTSVILDKWLIERVFQQARDWDKQGIHYPISVNLGAPMLQSDQLITFLETMLSTYPCVPAELIEIEVLETSALEDIRHVSKLIQNCNDLGIKVAIDDFGTGYSSLEYLKNLPASYLKIDQSFVRDMLIDNNDLAILKAIIGLAKAFDMQTIAEGVETQEHCDRLIELGCYLGQGYGIAKPMSVEHFERWIQR